MFLRAKQSKKCIRLLLLWNESNLLISVDISYENILKKKKLQLEGIATISIIQSKYEMKTCALNDSI